VDVVLLVVREDQVAVELERGQILQEIQYQLLDPEHIVLAAAVVVVMLPVQILYLLLKHQELVVLVS
jgi:hypothetical protein